MKVKMLEHYQGAGFHYAPGEVVDVDEGIGAWLLEHRKAEKVEEIVVQFTEQKEVFKYSGEVTDFIPEEEQPEEPKRKRGKK